jgi:hypothetical protein
MRSVLIGFGLLVLGASGCASSAESVARQAAVHQQRADTWAARRDYRRAAIEQQRADELNREAYRRANRDNRAALPPPPPSSPGYYHF